MAQHFSTAGIGPPVFIHVSIRDRINKVTNRECETTCSNCDSCFFMNIVYESMFYSSYSIWTVRNFLWLPLSLSALLLSSKIVAV